MRYLLDTNTCIAILTLRSEPVATRWRSLQSNQVRLSSVVKAELLFGAEKSSQRDRVLEKLRVFFARFRSMPFDDRAAEIYGEVRASLERQGKPIGPNDLLLASIALSNELTLVTHNTDEFSRVPELQLEDWDA